MNKKQLKQNLEPILSRKEIEVVIKRLSNKHITQTESNYLSRSIRPKLKSAEYASDNNLLSLLDYRRKKYEREESTLKDEIIASLDDIMKDVKAIVLYGSYIRNHHTDYRDIDVMVILKNKIWKTASEKNRIEKDIENKIEINADMNLVYYKELKELYPYSPLLRNEMEHHKVIYGNIELEEKIIVSKPYLYKKLLEIEYVMEIGKNINPKYIYNAIRSCISIRLFLEKKVSNWLVIDTTEKNIGETTALCLSENKANKYQVRTASNYLKYLYNTLIKLLKDEQERTD
ncbi:MAG: nucleotidyltransferase domain-containing protein [Nanoarchaeota archaeon]|nr:nucleotidyltransferase domain-containing protein [Nanoarchaeota archaeon]